MIRVARACFVVVFVAATVAAATAQVFPVLQGDPVDGFGRALPILPGVPLITANEDGDFKPPVIDANTIGDVDLVVRAGHVTPGATMPPPALVPPAFAAGGSRFPGGTDIPFTVIASDGDPTVAGGHPLLGPELDGIPVVVFAFADLDRDGFIGPTNADPDGAADNAREMQEAAFPVGMRVAYFTNGVAQGVLASDVGAPASSGGVPVVLTAAAYVGQFSEFLMGTVPDGPAITTLQPFFPRLDPDRVLDTDGSAGPALPNGRIAIEFEAEFEPPVNDPVLGTPFALPTDGSSVTIDRVSVSGAATTAARFVQPSSPTGLTGEEPRLPLHPGAGGALFAPMTESIPMLRNGPGNSVDVRIVPVDRLGNITDPAAPLALDLVVSHSLAITSPDTDGNSLHETVSVADGNGAVITVDDTLPFSGGLDGIMEALVDGAPVDRLSFIFSDPPGTAPFLYSVGFEEPGSTIALDCPQPKTMRIELRDFDDDATGVSAVFYQADVEIGHQELSLSETLPSQVQVWTAPLVLPAATTPNVFLDILFTARDAVGHESTAPWGISIAQGLPPTISDIAVSPTPLPAGKRRKVTISARVVGCGSLSDVTAYVQHRKAASRMIPLVDDGTNGDAVAGDQVFSGTTRFRIPKKKSRTSLAAAVGARNADALEAFQQFTIPIAR